MHPARPRLRGSFHGAPLRLPTTPVQQRWRLWLLAVFILATCLAAVLASATPAHAGARPPGDLSLIAESGHPMAPGEPSMHRMAAAESDAKPARAPRHADASQADWPERHAVRLAAPRPPAPAPAMTAAWVYRSPPAHAPPTTRQG